MSKVNPEGLTLREYVAKVKANKIAFIGPDSLTATGVKVDTAIINFKAKKLSDIDSEEIKDSVISIDHEGTMFLNLPRRRELSVLTF